MGVGVVLGSYSATSLEPMELLREVSTDTQH